MSAADASNATAKGEVMDDFPTRTGDLSRQWEWHGAFRDNVKNMYRTTYTDMVNGREVAVQDGLPSGYGGHIGERGHDVMFKNTMVYEEMVNRQMDPNRDSFPSFSQQKDGTATYQKNQAHEQTPTFGTLPDVSVQPPWAITLPIQEPPSYKSSGKLDPSATIANTRN